jgi:hypothetical protein
LLLNMFQSFPPVINAVLHERKPPQLVVQAEVSGTGADIRPSAQDPSAGSSYGTPTHKILISNASTMPNPLPSTPSTTRIHSSSTKAIAPQQHLLKKRS